MSGPGAYARAIVDTLLGQAERAAHALHHPRVRRVMLADPNPSPERDAEFGLLTLDDDSAGLYYAWLGGEQAELPRRVDAHALIGAQALTVARLLECDSDIERSLGIAAVNALTQSLYRRAGFRPNDAPDSFGGLDLQAGDRLGMVGNFVPLVRRARELGIPVCVVERKAHMVTAEAGLVVSLDPGVLARCNKIVCTGATLLNASLETALGWCRHAERLVLVGPTVGFFPDAVFARGVDSVAGTEIVHAEAAYAALRAGDRLGPHARRTVITRADYPGFEALLKACRA